MWTETHSDYREAPQEVRTGPNPVCTDASFFLYITESGRRVRWCVMPAAPFRGQEDIIQ